MVEKYKGAGYVYGALAKMNNFATVESIIKFVKRKKMRRERESIESLLMETIKVAIEYGFVEASNNADFRKKFISVRNSLVVQPPQRPRRSCRSRYSTYNRNNESQTD